jgi:HEPN pEK499 p136
MGVPTQPVLDIMRRTMANLDFIEEHAGENGPFAVTQLINSFVGALAHPWEAMRDGLETVPLAQEQLRGCPIIAKERGCDPAPENFGQLVKLMRHSFAHGNIDYIAASNGLIGSLRIWNVCPRRRVITWGASIRVNEMRAFLRYFVDLVERRHADFGHLAVVTE